jgi:hypothetical protein
VVEVIDHPETEFVSRLPSLDRFREQFAVLEQSSLKNDNFKEETSLPWNPI